MCITLVFNLKCTIIFHLFVLQDGYKNAMLVPAAVSHVYQQSQKAILSYICLQL